MPSGAARPDEQAPVRVEERAAVGQALHEALAVTREETRVELVAEAFPVVREERALHPFDDVPALREDLRIHLEAHGLPREAEVEEEIRVVLRTEDGADARAVGEAR